MKKRKRIVVMGFMASNPIAGVIWQHLHFIVGLQRLGHDVYYIEDSARYPYDPVKRTVTDCFDYAATCLFRLAREFGFERHWAFRARYLRGKPAVGLTRKRLRQVYRDADAILNVCGVQELHDDLPADRMIYVESDPGVEQIKVDRRERSTIKYLRSHRSLFTFGENVGTKLFPVPLHRMKWLPTRQPVVTDFWKTSRPPPRGAVFTSVANLATDNIKDIEWRGERYLWSKVQEFVRFLPAPRRSGSTFELAAEVPSIPLQRRFSRHGWRLRRAEDLSLDYWAYRDYVRKSKGEFTVAKDQYVRLKTGWFSDRSACYLAAGRPVITQETGFTRLYGGEEGLLSFRSLAEIREAVRKVKSDYRRHSNAARAIAREEFEAEKVLKSLLDRAGV